MPDWKTIAMPPQIAALPRDARGFPVPAFVYRPDGWETGQPLDLRVLDVAQHLKAALEELCGVCGGRLPYRLTFIGGPMCLFNRIFGDAAMHRDCAEYALAVCPHLSRSGADYNLTRSAEGAEHDPNVVRARPPYLVLVTTRGYKVLTHDPETRRELPKPLLKIDPWTACEFRADDGTPTTDTHAIITNPAGTALYCFSCISRGRPAISFNPHDVENRFCPSCKTFHQEPVVRVAEASV